MQRWLLGTLPAIDVDDFKTELDTRVVPESFETMLAPSALANLFYNAPSTVAQRSAVRRGLAKLCAEDLVWGYDGRWALSVVPLQPRRHDT